MKRAERRAQVLNCAREIFARQGYHRTSVSDIVQGAGIARGTFYLYFDNKRAIFEELLDELIEMLHAQFVRVEPSGDVLAQLRSNVVKIIDLFLDNRELTRILVHEAVGLDERFDQKLAEVFRRIHTMVEGSLQLGQEMGLVRACDTRIAARCVLGSVRETIYHLVVESDPSIGPATEVDREHLVVELLGYSLFGLVAPGALASEAATSRTVETDPE